MRRARLAEDRIRERLSSTRLALKCHNWKRVPLLQLVLDLAGLARLNLCNCISGVTHEQSKRRIVGRLFHPVG